MSLEQAGQGCSWTAILSGQDTSWVTLQAPTSGTALNGQVFSISYTVAPNADPIPRTVTLTVSESGGASLAFVIAEASPATPPLILTCTTPNGPATVGTPYTDTCTASGGTPPYTFFGSYCCFPGLAATIESTFVNLSGTPTTPEAGYEYRIYVSDSTPNLPQTVVQDFTGAIAAGGGPNCILNTGNEGLNQTLGPAGGAASFYFTATASGCTWNASAGASWVTLQAPSSGTTVAGVQTTVAFTLSPDTGTAGRNTVLTLTASSGSVATFGIYQTAPTRTTLTINCSTSAGPAQVGVPYLATCTGAGGTPPYAGQLVAGTLPAGITFTPLANGLQVSGTPAQIGPYNYVAGVTDSDPSQVQIAAQGFNGTIAGPPCTLSTAGQTLTATFSATGGSGTAVATPSSSGCSWSVSASTSWVTIQGPASGTTTALLPIGVPFSVAANSTSSSRSATVTISVSGGATATYSIQQSASPIVPLTVNCGTISGPNAVGTSYSTTCSATGGVPPYTFSIGGNSLPAGLQLISTSTTATISGAPTVAGPYSYALSVTDGEPAPQTASQSFSGTIAAGNQVSINCTTTLGPTQLNAAYFASCSASGGIGPYVFVISNNPLPAGLQMTTTSTTATISGTPTVAEPYRYFLSVEDNESPRQTATQAFVGTIVAGLSLSCTTKDGPTQINVAYSATCSASAGTPPYTFQVSNGLPAGLQSTSSATSITIAGSPAAAGNYSYAVSVTDSETNPQSASQSFAGAILAANSQCTSGPNAATGGGIYTPPYDTVGYGYLSLTFNAPGCPWSVSSSASWLSFLQSSGTLGSATSQAALLNFVTQPNTGAAPRVAVLTVTVDGKVALIAHLDQNASTCAYTISPQTIHLTAAGGPANFTLAVNPPNCTAFFSSPDWIGGFAGNGPAVPLFVPPNTGPARTATIFFGAYSGIASGPQSTATIVQDAGTSGMLLTCAQTSPYAAVSEYFQIQCEVAGGTAPYQWSISGSPPANLSLGASSGPGWYLTSGQPGQGPYNFTVSVTDSTSPKPLTATSAPIAGTISPPILDIQSGPPSTPTQGIPYSSTWSTIHGTLPITWSLISGALPSGLNFSAQPNGSVIISGTPTISGIFQFTLHVTDSSSPPITKTLDLTGVVLPAPLMTCTPLIGPALVAVKYSATCVASGGVPPYYWPDADLLPAGLSLTTSPDTTTATISGTPQNAVTYDYIVSVFDSSSPIGLGANQEYKGTIGFATAPVLSVSPPSLLINVPSGNPPLSAITQTISVFTSVPGVPFTAEPNRSGWLNVQQLGAWTPGNIQVSANVQNLQAGNTYSDQIVISAPDASPEFILYPVTIVMPAGPPVLGISPTQYTWPVVAGSAPFTEQIGVFNSGGGALSFSASRTGGSWLTAGVPSGPAVMGQPAILPYTINPAGLAPGTYSATIAVATLDGTQSIPVTVNLIVNTAPAQLSLSPNWISFTATAGGPAPPPQTLSILNVGQGTFTWSMNVGTLSGGPWLAASPVNGASTAGGVAGISTISVDVSQLGPGTYYGTIYVFAATAPNPQTLTVSLNVLPAGQNQPPQANPSGLMLTAAAPSATLTLSNFGSQPLTFTSATTTADGGDWLTVSPASGSVAPGVMSLTVAASTNLPAGVRQGEIRIAFGDGTVSTVSVALVLPANGSAQSAVHRLAASAASESSAPCVPTQLVPLFTSVGPGFTLTATQPVNLQAVVVDNCANPVSAGSVVLEASTGDPGIGLSPVGGSFWQGTWTPVTASPATTLTLAALDGAVSGETQLQGTIAGRPANAPPQITSVLNSASYVSLNQAPSGTWVSIFGTNLAATPQTASSPYPAVLNGTQVLIGSTSLPLQFAGPKQINALIPDSVPTNSVQSLVVESGGMASAPALVTVAEYLPALYSVNQLGSGQGAILIANTSSLAAPTGAYSGSRPVHPGEYLEIYAGGFGPTSNAPADGAPAPGPPNLAATDLQPSVTIGGIPAPAVSYSGLAPGEVGLYQIDVQVPASVAAGSAVPVVVTINGKVSNTVTIAVQ